MHSSRLVSTAVATIGAVALLATAAAPAALGASPKTVLVSKATNGKAGNKASSEPTLSKTGRYIAFASLASNLVPNDTNLVADCFVRDQVSKKTTRVSVSTSGTEGNSLCWGPAINDTGRFVAYAANASNLVSGDNNGRQDVFLHDRTEGTTTRVSVATGGAQGNDESGDPAISGSGSIIAFESQASNLVPGDNNGTWDVFVHDRSNGQTRRVSVRSNGQEANGASRDPAVSANGRFVVFDSAASNLVSKDTNGKRDVFIHDLATGKTRRVSVSSAERQGNGYSSNADVNGWGRFVTFNSSATNLVKNDTSTRGDVFVRDLQRGTTVRVSVSSKGRQANRASGDPTISDNGRYIAFESMASNLVAKDTNNRKDVFIRDRIGKTTRIASIPISGGRTRNGHSDDPSISGDARFVGFESEATNMAAVDKNGVEDIYRRGPLR